MAWTIWKRVLRVAPRIEERDEAGPAVGLDPDRDRAERADHEGRSARVGGGTPETSRTAVSMTTSAIVVPRSGSSRISAQNVPARRPIGRASSRIERSSSRVARCAAAQTQTQLREL